MRLSWATISLRIAQAALLLCTFCAHAQCSRTLRYVVSDWQPYSFKSPTPAGQGIDVDILLAAAKQAGCNVEILTNFPSARTYMMFKRGEVDVLTGFSVLEVRRAYAGYTRSYRNEIVGVFGLSDALKPDDVKSYADVLDKKLHLLAPSSGYWGADYAAAEPALLQSKKLSKVDSPERALRMLSFKHGDLILNDSYVLQYTAKSLGVGPLQKMTLEPARARVHIALSKTSTTDADLLAIDQALEKLLTDGSIDRIFQRYGVKVK